MTRSRRRFIASAAAVSVASVTAGCSLLPDDEVSVTTGSVDVVGTRAEVTATVESLGEYDELDAAFEYRREGEDGWESVDAAPEAVAAPTELTGAIVGVDETEIYEWFVSLWSDAERVASGDAQSFTTAESMDPPSSEVPGLVPIEYDEYPTTGAIYDHWSGGAETHRWTDDPAGSGERVLEIPFEEGEAHAGNAALSVAHPDLGLDTNEYGRAKRVYQQFRFYLPADFELPAEDTLRFCFGAMSHSSGDAHSGGGVPDGTNGWTSRPYITRRDATDGTPPPDDGWHVGEYTYHMDQSDSEGGDGVVFGNVVVSPGRWTTIETEVVCNTWSGSSANADGVARCWVDGEWAYEERGFRWTTAASNLVEFCGFNGYYWPGGEGSPTAQSMYVTDHAVSTDARISLV